MSRQDRVPGGVGQHMGLICALAWGPAPTVMSEHLSRCTSEIRHPRPRRQVPAGCLSHRGGLREIRKPVLAQGKRQGPTQSEQGHCLQMSISCHIQNLPTPARLSSLFSHQRQGQGHPKPGSLPSRGRCLGISSRGLEGAFLKAGRSLGLSLCQKEASSLKTRDTGCWVPPWLPIILGHRRRAPQ